MKPVLLAFGILALVGLAGAGAVIGFGLYNVSARDGHLPPTTWALHTTFRNAVERMAPSAAAVPPLTEPMARLGARHFDGACRTCHGAPGEERSWTVRSMVPTPPPITEAVAGWEPQHLHWIVYEGVKMSGMPHWPSIREDEVWAVVAFLARVEDMDAATYAAWTATPEGAGEGPPGLAYCADCHGVEGRSGNPLIPRLDLQSEAYLAQSLESYRQRRRESGIMAHAATAVPAETLPALAAWFAAQTPGEVPQRPDPALAALGEALAHAATDDPEVPACVACHGPAGAAPPTGPGPAIAGQHEPYLAIQLRLWREGLRGGGPRAELMRKAAQYLSDEEIAALAAYYAGLPPEPREP